MSNSPNNPHVTDWRLSDSEAEQAHGSELSTIPARRTAPAFVEQFAARIRSSPCATNVSSDYTDARYFLDRAVATGDSSTELSVQTDAFPGIAQCLTATNLAELAAGTHRLAAGTVVQVFSLYTRPGKKVYVFNHRPPEGAVVMITGPAGGGGKYTGRILSGSSSAPAGTMLAMPEGLSVPPSDNALICNEEEDGQAGHRLSIPCYATGEITGTHDGLQVVMIRGALGSTAVPTTLGDGTGGGLSPDSGAWSRASDATPADVWVQTRTVWDSGSGTLFAFVRRLSFDARGVLYRVSAENQVTVDVAQPCS
jgi:hypothetical protein